jgi:protein TonB
MSGRLRLSFIQACIASLLIHSAIALPFMLPRLIPKAEEPPTLVIDLQGVVSDEQEEASIQEQVKGATAPDDKTADAAPPPKEEPSPPPPEPEPEKSQEALPETAVTLPTPPPPTPEPGKDKSNVAGAQQQQIARSIRSSQQERDALSEYVKTLSKKIRRNLSYVNSGHRASAIVSFTILPDGRIRSETLKIVESTGQAKLDANALQTIRISAPFEAPPEQLNVAIVVDFEQRH